MMWDDFQLIMIPLVATESTFVQIEWLTVARSSWEVICETIVVERDLLVFDY